MTRQLIPNRARRSPAGFTLIEILVTVGILVVVTGLLLTGVLRSRKTAANIRVASDLQLIGTGLEAYKGLFGEYPRFSDPSTDQGSASIGGNGTWLDYSPNRGAVLLCRAMIGPGPARSSGNIYANPGDDGADGPGFRVRLSYNSATGQVSGNTPISPFVDAGKFKIGYATPPQQYANFPMAYPVILDSNGNPILYYPASPGNPPAMLGYNDPQATNININARFNGFDNQNYIDASKANSAFQTLAASAGGLPYILWDAGADNNFGLDSSGKTDDITNFDLPANLKK